VSHGIIFQLDENLLTYIFLAKLRTKGYGGNLLETKGLHSAKLSMKTHHQALLILENEPAIS
jgi:hypothetical protein